MNSEEMNSKTFLNELYQRTGGDANAQVSMHDIGEAIGLDKAESGSLAEELMVQGQVELKTLAGGIGITEDGLEVLGVAVSSPQSATPSAGDLQFNKGPIASEEDHNLINLLTEEIKKEISDKNLEFKLLEEIILDLKTLEVQCLSPKPKIGIVKEVFRSLHGTLEAAKIENIASKLKSLLAGEN